MALKKIPLSEAGKLNLKMGFSLTEEDVENSFDQLDQVLREKGFPDTLLTSGKDVSPNNKEIIN